MNGRVASVVAWGSLALSGLSVLVTLVLLLGFPAPTSIQIGPQEYVFAFSFLGFSVVGGRGAARRPHNPLGWLFLAAGLLTTLAVATSEYGIQALYGTMKGWPAGEFSVWLSSWLAFPGIGVLTFILLLFPNGKLLSPRWRPVAWLAALLPIFAITVGAFVPVEMTGGLGNQPLLDHNPFGVHALGFLVPLGPFLFPSWAALIAAAAISMVLRLRRSSGDERQQLKLFGFAAIILAIAALSSAVLDSVPALAGIRPSESVLGAIGMLSVATATGVAILRYRLYEVDVVISRTVTYAALAALITAVYLAVVIGIGSLVGRGNSANIFLSVIATAIVALAFQPVRTRLQHIADRLVYGRRASPYEVLSEMSRRVAEAYGEDLLPRMAQVLAQGTGAQQAEVWLRIGGDLRRAAAWPEATGEPPLLPVSGTDLPTIPGSSHVVPVRHADELLGALALVKRPGDALSPIELKLVEDLANEAGLVLRNVALTEELREHVDELRASRQRLVTAQDAERRRLERNLHDGAQQNLVALRVKLGLARSLALKDPGRVTTLLGDLDREANEAIETLRDLARGIYPPLLADQGLAAALTAQARKATVPVSVKADGIGRYPAEVEATVYFCCLEALQNVQKYAHASVATVSLDQRKGQLCFAVEDDGSGFEPKITPKGAGLTNLADRLDALGGTLRVDSRPGAGTRLTGSVPAVTLTPSPLAVEGRTGGLN
jgi:signal transduction histidine kinase